jgi:hypothetical protein
MMIDWKSPMRLVRRSAAPQPAQLPAAIRVNDERHAWIEALFGSYLPREQRLRENAMRALCGNAQVWESLHQARHSTSETDAMIEQLAARALDEIKSLESA